MKKEYILIAFIFTLVFTTSNVVSQIIYTDVNPDTTINEFLQGYGVDFDDNDKIDLHITLLSNVGVWVMHLIPDMPSDFTYVVYDGEEASVLVDGDYISASSDLYRLGSGWGGLLYGYWDDSGEFGNWTGIQEDKYLGIKFEIGNDFHYGWIHLTTIVYDHDDMEFTVKGFAYNSVPNEGIDAGDKGIVGLVDNEINEITIYPNPVKDILNLPSTINDGVVVSISDISGRVVWQNESQYNSTIDVSRLNAGLYIIHVQVENKVYTAKIVKE